MRRRRRRSCAWPSSTWRSSASTVSPHPASGAGAPAGRPRALSPAFTALVRRRGGAGSGGGGGDPAGGSHRRPPEGGRGEQAGGQACPLGPGGGGGLWPPPAGPGPPPLSPPLLPQLEQKGRLQRLVAKDVSGQRWGAARL